MSNLKCNHCGFEGESSYFYKNKSLTRGYSYRCKPCDKINVKAVYKKNPDSIKQAAKRWKARNREHVLEQGRQYAKANSLAFLERQRKWRKSNPEQHARLQREAYWKSPEKYREYKRQYRLQHPLKIKLRNAIAHARRRMLSSDDLASNKLHQKMMYWGFRCCLCRGDFESVDHVKPLNKGGGNQLANLRPSCHRCNRSKSDKWCGVKNLSTCYTVP